MYVVVKNVDGREHGVDRDGTTHRDPAKAELMQLAEAEQTAAVHGGVVVDEERMWPDADDFDCYE